MLDIDKKIFDFIENLQKDDGKYHLFTTIPDFSVCANFHMISNNNYEVSFELNEDELNKGIDSDYFLQRPFVLASKGGRILIQNYDVISVRNSIIGNPRKYNIEIKAFKSDTNENMWINSKQVAYIRFSQNIFKPFKSGIRFDLTTDNKRKDFFNSLRLNIDNVDLIFYYEYINSSNDGYYIFRPNGFIDFKKFKKIIDSVIIAFGFINGYSMLDTVYYFSYKEISGTKSLTFKYDNLKSSFNTKEPLIDSDHYKEIAFEKHQVSSNQFNNLANLLYNNEEYLRSAEILINAGKLSGCSKASVAIVALETITKKIETVSSKGQIVEDKEISKNLRHQLIKTLESFSGKLTKEQIKTLTNKINQLNNKPNISKLEDAFRQLSITLDEEELYCINCRNQFLHGNLPQRDKDIWPTDDELLNIVANRLVMLSSILLLKMAGYKGMVIDRGMTEVVKWRMIRNCQKVDFGNMLREI